MENWLILENTLFKRQPKLAITYLYGETILLVIMLLKNNTYVAGNCVIAGLQFLVFHLWVLTHSNSRRKNWQKLFFKFQLFYKQKLSKCSSVSKKQNIYVKNLKY